MLFSKANLAVKAVASRDPKRLVLNGVHLTPDGATVGTNGRMLLAVGPVDEDKVHYPDVGDVVSPPSRGVTAPLEIIEQATKNLPKDKRMSLQHVALTRCDERKVEFTTTDQTKEQRVAGAPIREGYPDWVDVLRKARKGADRGRVCLNRRDLIQMLEAIDQACPDRGAENPVFIEFGGETDGLVMRAPNYETGQQAVGFVMPLDTGGRWLRSNSWVKQIFGTGAKRRKRKD